MRKSSEKTETSAFFCHNVLTLNRMNDQMTRACRTQQIARDNTEAAAFVRGQFPRAANATLIVLCGPAYELIPISSKTIGMSIMNLAPKHFDQIHRAERYIVKKTQSQWWQLFVEI
ncbi:unnamed protein product [Arctia plantaginis]|uniref:Uncharacterized protein n=1 Tax=Arctia plantaginis TaxID=874455 RepID=A0A8S1AGY8_ARCPL|nr:unnamed protein product [Arctia plantaginis]